MAKQRSQLISPVRDQVTKTCRSFRKSSIEQVVEIWPKTK